MKNKTKAKASIRKKIIIISAILLLALGILCLALFASCGAEKYKKRLEKAGYEVDEWSSEYIAEYFAELNLDYEITTVISAEKDGGSAISIFFFEKESEAQSFQEILKTAASDTFKLARKGNIVFFGVTESVDIALGK